MYDQGEGAPLGDKEAVKWHTRAAGQGYAKAQSNLGFMHVKGKGCLQSDFYSYMWWSIASSNESKNVPENPDLVAKKKCHQTN